MLPPRKMQAVGVVLLAASLYGSFAAGLDEEALIVGVPLGLAIVAASLVGGGPEPSTPGGEGWEEAMATLRRVTVATSLVAGAFAVSVAWLWGMGGATAPGVGPVDVLVVFALALLLVYAAIVAAAAILLLSHVTGRDEA